MDRPAADTPLPRAVEVGNLAGRRKVVDPARVSGGLRTRTRGDAVDWRARALALPGARRGELPSPFRPQLATLRPAPPAGEDWLHEIKWDGFRLLAERRDGMVRLRTRNGLDWTDRFPTLARACALLPADAVIDGELVALDARGRSDFPRLQRAIKARDTDALRLLAFDLPGLAGVDLRGCALVDRKALLQELLASKPSQALHLSRHIVGNGPRVFAMSKKQGAEGIVSKRLDARYEQSRSASWIKVKHEDSDEFVIVGYTAPRGARSHFGALLMARNDRGRLRYAGRVGTGYDAATLRELLARMAPLRQEAPVVEIPAHATIRPRNVHWVRPRLVAEVAFRGWGTEGLLRQAAFKRLREDKSAADLSSDSGAPA
jgi:bifunctional non-homologous end joining protein LigD